jgi:TRAP-type mannitol/chloroaromatic compound transport system substrate-binding protein
MVTTWPKDFPIFQTSAEEFVKDIKIISNGQLDIQVFAYDEYKGIIKKNTLEDIFDAVSEGKVEMGHSASYYWADKIPGCEFMCTVPFGLNSEDMHAWLYRGRGLELWRKLYEPFNVIPFPVGNTGPAMGGWFNKKIEKVSDLKGLRIRIAGLGGEVYKKAGANPILLPASDILNAFENKKGQRILDAAVFQGPYHDQLLKMNRVAKYYYYPGWQEPGTVLEIIINKNAWDNLPPHLQEMIKAVSSKAYHEIYYQFEKMNSEYFKILKESEDVKIVEFPPKVMEEFRKLTEEVLKEGEKNTIFNEIYQAFKKFKEDNDEDIWVKINDDTVYSDKK